MSKFMKHVPTNPPFPLCGPYGPLLCRCESIQSMNDAVIRYARSQIALQFAFPSIKIWHFGMQSAAQIQQH